MPKPLTENTTVTANQPAQIIELVQRCTAQRTPIVDYGHAHKTLGHPPPPDHIQLILQNNTIEHYDRDLVVRVEAGTTIAKLQATLKKSNQFLPIDAHDDMTLGEVITHNVFGPLRVGFGAMRDLLLGLRYIDGHSRDIHVGGRTVKNVAGYDVTRLMVGSLGELGCIYEATLRTSAIPQTVLSVELSIDTPRRLDAITTDLLVSDVGPVHLALHAQANHWRVHLAYFGHTAGCRAQSNALETFLNRFAPELKIDRTQETTLDQDAQQRTRRSQWRRHTPALVKLIVPLAATGAVCRQLSQWATTYTTLQIDALPAHGRVFAGGDLDADSAHKLDLHTSQLAASVGGLRIWYARPTGTQSIDPWPPALTDRATLTKLKHAMDPHNLFNPGRFITAQQ